MTEAEWLEATDPAPMLLFLKGKASNRKMRLYAVASCYRIWGLIDIDSCMKAVEIGEKYADGLARDTDRLEVWRTINSLLFDLPLHSPPAPRSAWGAAEASRLCVDKTVKPWKHPDSAATARGCDLHEKTGAENFGVDYFGAVASEQASHTQLLRDIFGNPFRPVAVDPAWLTSDVVALAEGIYQDKAFDRLPILADALQDAGCDNADILAHCRDEKQVHVRGCWVVDLALGKE